MSQDPECGPAHRTRPEIETVVSQLGRPDDGTDVSGFYNIELFAPLKPSNEWPRGVTKESMTAALSKELAQAFPGVIFNFSQMISDNVEEALSGVKGENTVKVIGHDLRVNEAKANEIVDVMSTVRASRTWACSPRSASRTSASRPIAFSAGATGSTSATSRRWCRRPSAARRSPRSTKGRSTSTSRSAGRRLPQRPEGDPEHPGRDADGAQVPLGQLAQIAEEEGPSLIYREDSRRYAPVKFSVRGRDLASTIAEARSASPTR